MVDYAGSLHPGDAADSVQELLKENPLFGCSVIAWIEIKDLWSKLNAYRNRRAGEAAWHGKNLFVAAQKQTGAGEQHDDERDLGYHQSASQSSAASHHAMHPCAFQELCYLHT